MKALFGNHGNLFGRAVYLVFGLCVVNQSWSAPTIESVDVLPTALKVGEGFSIEVDVSNDVTRGIAIVDFRPWAAHLMRVILSKEGDLWVGEGTIPTELDPSPGNEAIVKVLLFDSARGRSESTVRVLVLPKESEELSIAIDSPTAGTVTKAVAVNVGGSVSGAIEVTVNGVVTSLFGGRFIATDIPLPEGTTVLVATARNSDGQTASATRSIRRDTTPPLVVFESPRRGDRLLGDSVAVAGTVNDIIPGATVNADDVGVTINGIRASVNNRTFFVENVPLQLGRNTLSAVAVDRAGNIGQANIEVIRETDLAGVQMRIISGNAQRGAINATLPNALTVQVQSRDGTPEAGRPVVFTVSRGDGLLDNPANNQRNLTILTDSDGMAETDFTLGTRTGEGFHRVRVSTPGSLSFAEFCATALTGTPVNIAVEMMPPTQSVAGQTLTNPISAIVTDGGGNTVDGVAVTFNIDAGGGNFGGNDTVTVVTDPDGMARTPWMLGPDQGLANNQASATFQGNPGFPAVFVVSGVKTGPIEQTRIIGIVQNSGGEPVVGARALVRGTALEAETGADGKFTILNVSPGGHHVAVLGSAANDPDRGIFFPDIEFALEVISGVENTLDQIVILPYLDASSAKLVGGNTDEVLHMAGVPGFSITVFARSTFIRDPDTGVLVQTPLEMSSSQVKFDKIPMPPPQGSTPLVVGTLQPGGVIFDPPARVCYPNPEGLAPGDVADVFAFHHDIGQFVNLGPGTVSEDGTVVCIDPGFGIVQSGWHCLIRLPGPTAQCANDCSATIQWYITKNGTGSGSTGPIVILAAVDPSKSQESRVTVAFSPGGGSNDVDPIWKITDTDIAEIVGAAGTGNSVIIRAKKTGITSLTSPTYRIPLPPDQGGDKTCQAQVEVRVIKVELRQDDVIINDGDIASISAAPDMPNLTARVVNGSENLTVRWRLKIVYDQGNRDDMSYFPGPTEAATQNLMANEIWDIRSEFGDALLGGDGTLRYRIGANQEQELKFRIWGKNPPQSTVRGELALLRHHLIAWREGRFQQFQTLAGFVAAWREGPFSVLHSGDNGLGIMQLTAGQIQINHLWNWRDNVNDGESRANGFTAAADAYNNQVQLGQQWTGVTGGIPPNEGMAFPNAPEFNADQLDRETWARYNSGFRYHDYDPIQNAWVNRNPTAPGNNYADDLATRKAGIQQNNVFPPLWD